MRFLLNTVIKSLSVLAIVLLTGCQSSQLTQANLNAQPKLFESNELRFGRECQNVYGYTYGTPAFGQCVSRLVENQRAESAAASANLGATLQFMQNTMGYQTPNVYQQNPVNNFGTATTPSIPNSPHMVQYLREYVEGNYKYCYYQQGQAVLMETIERWQTCPRF